MGFKFLGNVLVYVLLLRINFISCFSCRQSEREALLEFKQSLTDPSNRLSSWVGQDCCGGWDGVGCDNTTGYVIRLNLRNPTTNDGYTSLHETTWLVGSEVNPSLTALKHLEYLDLSSNSFAGSQIPHFFGNFKALKYLYLSFLSLTGTVPQSIENLSFLLALDLSGNLELKVHNLDWLPRLSVLQYLDMSQVNLSLTSNLSQALNSVPSLSELHLSVCELHEFPLSLSSYTNLTSLSVLELFWNHFQGQFPTVLENFRKLERLNLFHNEFSGHLPDWLSQLSNLRYLVLSENSFSGSIPTLLGALPVLRVVDLRYNQLSGSIPTSLGTSSSLQSINLRDNQLSGSIPYSFGTVLSNLSELVLDSNQLNGSIPNTLGQLSKLEILRVHNNSLTGVISEIHFANLSSLKLLDLGSNSLILRVSSDWVPPFQIQRIVIESCRLGPKFPLWLQTQKAIDLIDISNAGISDPVPSWFWNLTSHLVVLDLSKNQIPGSIPNLHHDPNVIDQRLLFSSNRFEGPLPHFPSNVGAVDLSNNSISGSLPQHIGDMMPNLIGLFLSNNNITGSIPASLCGMKALRILDISNNHLSGNLPQQCWSNSKDLQIVDLATNNLTGVLPSSLGYLPFLTSLHLSNNAFYGELPLSFKNCTNLRVLDLGENRLSGNIPSWIGGLSSLNVLRLRSNMFTGSLVPQVCHLQNLHIFDLAQNSLSGIIPPCVHNFSGMVVGDAMDITNLLGFDEKLNQVIKGRELEYTGTLLYLVNLDLSSNNLVGKIPVELASLEGLRALNLSSNHLTGSIPKKIGNLKALESLDFSRNRLSGTIPESISDLSFMSHLNLSYNNLSGKIPNGNQLETLGSSPYVGNTKLCGVLLGKKCWQQVPSQATEDDLKEEFEHMGFYISMAVGVGVGFWGVFGVLFFKKSWRYTYFQLVEKVYDLLFVTSVHHASWLKKKLTCN